jgi:hypothetical protein
MESKKVAAVYHAREIRNTTKVILVFTAFMQKSKGGVLRKMTPHFRDMAEEALLCVTNGKTLLNLFPVGHMQADTVMTCLLIG